MDGRKLVRQPRQRRAVDVAPDRVDRAEVDIRKCLEISLGMPPWDPSGCPGLRGEILGAAARERLPRLTMSIQLEVVRILLLPDNRALRRINPYAQGILLAGRDLTHREHPLAAAAKPQQR